MPAEQFTLDDLRRALDKYAGADEETDLDGDILDVAFDELGYDSLSLLNTLAAIERQRAVKLADDLVADAKTPRQLLEKINEALAG